MGTRLRRGMVAEGTSSCGSEGRFCNLKPITSLGPRSCVDIMAIG